MLLTRREPDSSPEQLSSLAALGNQIGMAVDNARLYEHAEESAAAAERNRLARDLHDAVSQTLFSVSLIAEVLPRIYARDPVQGAQRLDELRQLTRGALAEMRTLLLELRPAALAEANLATCSSSWAKRSRAAPASRSRWGPRTRSAAHRRPPRLLPDRPRGSEQRGQALRGRHGHGVLVVAGRARGRAPPGDTRRWSGFRPRRGGTGQLGLGIMRERAEAIGASLTISSAPGQGTTVSATWSPQQPDTQPKSRATSQPARFTTVHLPLVHRPSLGTVYACEYFLQTTTRRYGRPFACSLEELGERDILEAADELQLLSVLGQEPRGRDPPRLGASGGGLAEPRRPDRGSSSGGGRAAQANVRGFPGHRHERRPESRVESLRAGCDGFVGRNEPPDRLSLC